MTEYEDLPEALKRIMDDEIEDTCSRLTEWDEEALSRMAQHVYRFYDQASDLDWNNISYPQAKKMWDWYLWKGAVKSMKWARGHMRDRPWVRYEPRFHL